MEPSPYVICRQRSADLVCKYKTTPVFTPLNLPCPDPFFEPTCLTAGVTRPGPVGTLVDEDIRRSPYGNAYIARGGSAGLGSPAHRFRSSGEKR